MLEVIFKILFFFTKKEVDKIPERDSIDLRKDVVGGDFVLKDYKKPGTRKNRKINKT